MTRLELLKNRLQAYYDAELKILNGQEYRIGDRTLRRADLSEIRKAIGDLEDEISVLENRNGSVRRVVFVT